MKKLLTCAALSVALLEDNYNKEIAQTLFTNYIEKTVTAIEEGKINTAINIYVAMTNSLMERYQTETNLLTIDTNEPIDIELLGHARTRKKVLETN